MNIVVDDSIDAPLSKHPVTYRYSSCKRAIDTTCGQRGIDITGLHYQSAAYTVHIAEIKTRCICWHITINGSIANCIFTVLDLHIRDVAYDLLVHAIYAAE